MKMSQTDAGRPRPAPMRMKHAASRRCLSRAARRTTCHRYAWFAAGRDAWDQRAAAALYTEHTSLRSIRWTELRGYCKHRRREFATASGTACGAGRGHPERLTPRCDVARCRAFDQKGHDPPAGALRRGSLLCVWGTRDVARRLALSALRAAWH
jgi:hypothetical protein